MAEPINNPVVQDPTPGTGGEVTFTQAEVDALISKEKARAVAKATKGIPDEAELNAFRTWKENQQSERDKWERLTGEREALSGKLTKQKTKETSSKEICMYLKRVLVGKRQNLLHLRPGRW